MVFQQVQAIAGIGSVVIFISSNFPMLIKAFVSKDLKSYSLGQIGLANFGNLALVLYGRFTLWPDLVFAWI